MSVADKMMAAAKAAVGDLHKTDENELYKLLALRLQAIQLDPAAAGSFTPKIQAAEVGIAPSDLLKIGKEAFGRLAVAAQPLVCGTGADQGYPLQRLLGALSTDVTTVTAAVASLLIAQLAIAPAIAGVVAALVVGKVAPTSVAALCKAWGAKVAAVKT
jgi:hypothetical protein